MKSEFIDSIVREINQLEDGEGPIDRLLGVIKISLREYPALKDEFLSGALDNKKNAVQATQYLINQVEREFQKAASKTGLQGEHLLALLYQSEKLSPEECQLFLQARASISQYHNELFQEKDQAKKPKLPKRIRI